MFRRREPAAHPFCPGTDRRIEVAVALVGKSANALCCVPPAPIQPGPASRTPAFVASCPAVAMTAPIAAPGGGTLPVRPLRHTRARGSIIALATSPSPAIAATKLPIPWNRLSGIESLLVTPAREG
jgi:hypothetical protein